MGCQVNKKLDFLVSIITPDTDIFLTGEWGQVYHPHARYVGPVYAGKPISFITAIVPFDSGEPNNNITAGTVPSPPNYTIKVSDGTGTVLIGNRIIHFGKSNLYAQTGPAQYDNHPVKFSVEVQEGFARYMAALLDDGKDTKFETTYHPNPGTQPVSSTSVATPPLTVIIG